MRLVSVRFLNEMIPLYECEVCKTRFDDSDPRVELEDGKTYCGDCAFINNIITEAEYIKSFCYWFQVENVRAVVHEGKVYVAGGRGKFPWEPSNSKNRNRDGRYAKWRTSVFTRDHFTCQECGKIGGELNAHHIKAWKSYPELRYELSNGKTLCYECHKEYHRKNGK